MFDIYISIIEQTISPIYKWEPFKLGLKYHCIHCSIKPSNKILKSIIQCSVCSGYMVITFAQNLKGLEQTFDIMDKNVLGNLIIDALRKYPCLIEQQHVIESYTIQLSITNLTKRYINYISPNFPICLII